VGKIAFPRLRIQRIPPKRPGRSKSFQSVDDIEPSLATPGDDGSELAMSLEGELHLSERLVGAESEIAESLSESIESYRCERAWGHAKSMPAATGDVQAGP
jgi:hypothetical protein